jgi:hypothetical protein
MQALFFLPRNYLFLFAARIFIEFPKCYHAKLIVWSKYQIGCQGTRKVTQVKIASC